MRTAHRRSFVLLAATAATTTLAGCATGAADAGTHPTSAVDAATTPQEAAPDASGTDGAQADAPAVYADGTYTATGSYKSPGGQEDVTVTLTLADGAVTAVEVTPEATDPTSLVYQTRFASGVAEQVVGRALDDVDVDKVSGSSLTSTGFMAALEEIAAGAAG